MYCSECGKYNDDDSNFCIYCGTKLIKTSNTSSQNNLEKIKVNEEVAKNLRYGSDSERNRAIKIYEENVSYGMYCESYKELVSMYMEKQEYTKAVDVAKKGIEIYAQNGKDTTSLEMMLENSEMSEKIKIQADANIYGEQLEKEGKTDEAIEVYESNILIHADTPFTYRRLSIIYRKQKEIDNEIRVLKHGIKNCRKNPNKSHVEGFKKALEKAKKRKEKTKTQRLPPVDKNHKERDNEANELLKQGEITEAIKIYELNVKENTISNNTYSKLVKLYVESEQYRDAERICKKAIAIYKPVNSSKVSQYRQKLLNVYDKK